MFLFLTRGCVDTASQLGLSAPSCLGHAPHLSDERYVDLTAEDKAARTWPACMATLRADPGGPATSQRNMKHAQPFADFQVSNVFFFSERTTSKDNQPERQPLTCGVINQSTSGDSAEVTTSNASVVSWLMEAGGHGWGPSSPHRPVSSAHY